MKCATITLTEYTTGTDNFDLFSDDDGYTTPFETGISQSALIAGYETEVVPDATTIIRVKSNTPQCTNYVDTSIASCDFGGIGEFIDCPIPTPTPTSTPSVTPTHTPSVTPTRTPVATPSITPTRTPVATPTPTVTPTITPTITPTPTPTPTNAAVPTTIRITVDFGMEYDISSVEVNGTELTQDQGDSFPVWAGDPTKDFTSYESGPNLEIEIYFVSPGTMSGSQGITINGIPGEQECIDDGSTDPISFNRGGSGWTLNGSMITIDYTNGVCAV